MLLTRLSLVTRVEKHFFKLAIETKISYLFRISVPAVSNRNYLLSQKLCHYLCEGRTLNDLLSS